MLVVASAAAAIHEQIHKAGKIRNARRDRNSPGLEPRALSAMTKPEMTKNISTPTQPKALMKFSRGNARGAPMSGRALENTPK
jgi:hypothetical protein